MPPKTRAAKAKQATKADKKTAAEGGGRGGRGGAAAGGRGRGAKAAPPAARAASPRQTRAAGDRGGADRTGAAAGAAAAAPADPAEPVQAAGNDMAAAAAAQPPAAEMVGQEGVTDPKDGAADDKAKEEDASAAPLPEKVREQHVCSRWTASAIFWDRRWWMFQDLWAPGGTPVGPRPDTTLNCARQA